MSSLLKNVYVLWPVSDPPGIFEVQFAYEFCRKQSKKLCPSIGDLFWIDYAKETTIGEVLSAIPENADLLVVADPLIVIHESMLRQLRQTLQSGFNACGPAFNETRNSLQQAGLDYVYQNMSTFLEVAGLHAAKSVSHTTADILEPGCVLFSVPAIRGLGLDVPVPELINHFKSGLAVTSGALVHRFFNIFDALREDLISLVPENVSRILDVGCARGGYGKCLKGIRPDVFLAGVEMNPMMAKFARSYYDDIFVCPVESLDLPYAVDLINCGEVLEHLENPWNTLDVLSSMVNPGGYIVLSVPNANHWAIVRDLFRGCFQYIPWGPQCVTHVRWFTENDIVDALQDSGFIIDLIQRVQPPPTPAGNQFIQDLIDKGYGDQKQLLTVEIIIRARKKK